MFSIGSTTIISTAIPDNAAYWRRIDEFNENMNEGLGYPEGPMVKYKHGTGPTGIFRSMIPRNVDPPYIKTSWKEVYPNISPLSEKNGGVIREFDPSKGYDVNEVVVANTLEGGPETVLQCIQRTYVIDDLSERSLERSVLEVSKYYSLKFHSPWEESDYDVRKVKVIAVTDNESSGLFTNDSIYSEFFETYGLGLSDFLKRMGAVPDMYVCEIVQELDPIKVKDQVVIPKSILDIEHCEELLLCDKLTATVQPIIKHHKFAYERGEYLDQLQKNMREKLREVRQIADAMVEVGIEPGEMLVPESTYDEMERQRIQSLLLQDRAKASANSQYLENLRNMNQEMSKLEIDVTNMNEIMRLLSHLIAQFNAFINTLMNSFSAFEKSWDSLKYKILHDEPIDTSEKGDLWPIDDFISSVKNSTYLKSMLTPEDLEIMISDILRAFVGGFYGLNSPEGPVARLAQRYGKYLSKTDELPTGYLFDINNPTITKGIERTGSYTTTNEFGDREERLFRDLLLKIDRRDNEIGIGDDIRMIINRILGFGEKLTLSSNLEWSAATSSEGNTNTWNSDLTGIDTQTQSCPHCGQMM